MFQYMIYMIVGIFASKADCLGSVRGGVVVARGEREKGEEEEKEKYERKKIRKTK